MQNASQAELFTDLVPEKSSPATSPTTSSLPPMLSQYLDYKQKYPDTLLFFQVGDFYEVFFNDAVTVAKTLNLTLTSRDKNSAEPIPMCGVPISVIDGYVERLVDAGFSAAIVSQIAKTDESQKGMMQRSLERIVTPAVRILAGEGASDCDSILASVYLSVESEEAAIAFCNVTSAVIWIVESVPLSNLLIELQGILPLEIIIPKQVESKKLDRRNTWLKDLDNFFHSSAVKYRNLASTSTPRQISTTKGFSSLSSPAKNAVRLLTEYLDETTVNEQIKFSEVKLRTLNEVMKLDATTRTNLELLKNIRTGGTQGTLLGFLDQTKTAAGARVIRAWLKNPSISLSIINERLKAVSAAVANYTERQKMLNLLHYSTDLERIAARIELNVVSPKELGAGRDFLQKIPEIKSVLANFKEAGALASLKEDLSDIPELRQELERTLTENPSYSINDGNIIKAGVNIELDKLRDLNQTGRSWIAELELKEKAASGINSLKIRYNNILGFFIEITKANLAKVPKRYIRRQSTVNVERFTTPELAEREQEVLGAEEKLLRLEKKLFEELQKTISPHSGALRELSAQIGELDVLLSFAEISEKEGFTAPEVDESRDLIIDTGRHPVIAKLLSGGFIANSLNFSAETGSFYVLTGPNMGGKSTYLRQAALIVILAQIGCFVPAKSAKVGLVDRIFARIGASDNLLEGESTFMVEMREAAHIIQSASDKSLVLIDEIGRGTATADGLAIAQAILEWLSSSIKCRTLFATHFHELTALDGFIKNISVGSVEQDGDVIFTHEICAGPANCSYGIEVAKLSGLPAELILRARELLLNSPTRNVDFVKPISEIVINEPADYKKLKALAQNINSININEITPVEALLNLQQLKKLSL